MAATRTLASVVTILAALTILPVFAGEKSGDAPSSEQILSIDQVPGSNPAPAEKFANFARFELKPLVVSEGRHKDKSYVRVTGKIQEIINTNFQPAVEGWNAKPTPAKGARTLVIEPRINNLKFSSAATRFFAGPLSGSSYVIMSVKFYDKDSGKEVAHPIFYQRTAAMSGAMTVGGQDNAMLYRIVSLLSDYTKGNYDNAVGGATGSTKDGGDKADASDEAEGGKKNSQ